MEAFDTEWEYSKGVILHDSTNGCNAYLDASGGHFKVLLLAELCWAEFIAVVYDWILFSSTFRSHLCVASSRVVKLVNRWTVYLEQQGRGDALLYNTRSLLTDCSSDCQKDHSWRCHTQMEAKRRAEENSAIDHGHQARSSEFYTMPAVNA